MRMSRRPEALDDVAVARRQLETRAGRLLPNGRAVELLPWRLVLGIGIAAPGLEQSKPAAGRSLRRGVEDRGRARSAGLSAVADAGQRGDPALDQRGRRLHVHNLRAAGVTDRPGAADE